jgi:nucleotidyltransferase substrate binding protein (TIGR01987 family)
MGISIDEFSRAVEALKEALEAEKTDLHRDAAIQRFEFCVELAWKCTRKVMGTHASAPKQVVREMAQNNYIDDVELWLKAIDQRNLTAHTYNADLAEEVYAFAKSFLPLAQSLKAKLKV